MAVLRLAMDAHKRGGEEQDWLEALRCMNPYLPDEAAKALQMGFSKTATTARAGVSYLVYQWLEMGDVRPMANWEDEDEPKLQLTSTFTKPSLFGVLASQVMLAVARSNEMAQCSGCSRLYLREGRRARKGERNFCQTCRKTSIPVKLRQRTRRAKLADEGAQP